MVLSNSTAAAFQQGLVSIDRGASTDVFNQTMQLLAKRASISSLYLWPADSDKLGISNDGNDRVYIPTLVPVKHVIGQLEGVSIVGIQFDDLARDLEQLAATAAATVAAVTAGSWPLKILKLKAIWSSASGSTKIGHNCPLNWSKLASVLKALAHMFPTLTG